MKTGPGGALGLVKGCVRSHARKAGTYSGRKRRRKSSAALWLPVLVAKSHELKVVVS